MWMFRDTSLGWLLVNSCADCRSRKGGSLRELAWKTLDVSLPFGHDKMVKLSKREDPRRPFSGAPRLFLPTYQKTFDTVVEIVSDIRIGVAQVSDAAGMVRRWCESSGLRHGTMRRQVCDFRRTGGGRLDDRRVGLWKQTWSGSCSGRFVRWAHLIAIARASIQALIDAAVVVAMSRCVVCLFAAQKSLPKNHFHGNGLMGSMTTGPDQA